MAHEQDELARLLAARDKFLSEHPHLRPMQAEIDRTLSKAGSDPSARLVAVFDMLLDQFKEELLPATNELLELEKALLEDVVHWVDSQTELLPLRKTGK